MSALLDLISVSKTFENGIHALEDVSLSIEAGELTSNFKVRRAALEKKYGPAQAFA